MAVAHELAKSGPDSSPKASWRRKWRIAAGLTICVALAVALFYSEENFRGQRAWDDCRHTLKARGIDTDWNHLIPAPVPDAENVFGVPEMQSWFVNGAAGWDDLARKLPHSTYPGLTMETNAPRMVLARVVVVRSATAAPGGFNVLRWDDPASRAAAAKLLTDALGPAAKAPQSRIGLGLMLRRPEEVQPARICFQCQTTPTAKALADFLPDNILPVNADLSERVLKFDPDGDDAWRVTIPTPVRAADYLAWCDGLEPQFAIIRNALRRPYCRMQGYYGNPDRIPYLNFRAGRALVQTLGARAQCRLLLDQPGEALDDLALAHDFRRRLAEERTPMTLLAAMVNVAVGGFSAAQVNEGVRLHAWRESDLAALQDQLKSIDVVAPVKQSYLLEVTGALRSLESVPSGGLIPRSTFAGWCPRGWGYRNMADYVRVEFDRLDSIDTSNQVIFADRVDAAGRKTKALEDGGPYKLAGSLGSSPFARAVQRTAQVQTQINQAVIACALERYRLVHGEYPETLEALLPQFLDTTPHDVIGGQSPHYRRAADGTFVLYSIAWSGQDKGGMHGTNGDWIWPD